MNFFKTKNKGDLAPYLDRSPFRLEVKNGETVATKKSRAQDTAGFLGEKRRKERRQKKGRGRVREITGVLRFLI